MNSTRLIKTLVEEIVSEALGSGGKLRIFDFDDTLAETESMIYVKKDSGEDLVLTPAEYAVYEKDPGDEFNFSDFEGLINPKEKEWVTKILKRVIRKHGTDGAVILTARGHTEPVKAFFDQFGIEEIPIVALSSSAPDDKAQWILYVAKKFGFSEIEFFDDSYKNIVAADKLADKETGLIRGTKTRLKTRLIKH